MSGDAQALSVGWSIICQWSIRVRVLPLKLAKACLGSRAGVARAILRSMGGGSSRELSGGGVVVMTEANL